METSRWRINGWEHRGCPEKAFRIDSDLLILPQGPDACTLVWLSGEDKPELCWIENLPLAPSEVPVPVFFGGLQKAAPHVVSLVRQGNGLIGILTPADRNDGSGGTFTAEANGPQS